MRKRVYNELNEYEQIISMINDRNMLYEELRYVDRNNYNKRTLLFGIANAITAITSMVGLEKVIDAYINTNNLDLDGGLLFACGGLLCGLTINELVSIKERKYIDKEKVNIICKQIKPENGPCKNMKTK